MRISLYEVYIYRQHYIQYILSCMYLKTSSTLLLQQQYYRHMHTTWLIMIVADFLFLLQTLQELDMTVLGV
jgi:hypothetical protein